MAPSVEYRQQERRVGVMMKENDDDLVIFLEIRSRENDRKDRNWNSEEIEDQLGSKPDSSQESKLPSRLPAQKPFADDLLNSEPNKSDYDWLLTPPSTPLFPSLEIESQATVRSQIGISNTRSTTVVSEQPNPPTEPVSRGSNMVSGPPPSSTSSNTSSAGSRNLLSSRIPTSTGSRAATPTGRPTVPATAKPVRSSATTSQVSSPSTKATTPPMWSSTPARSAIRSSTPTARPSMPVASKPSSRPATPTRKLSTPSSRSSSVTKSSSTTSKNPVPSRGISPTVKSRPRKPSEMPGFSSDASPNLRTSMPKRPTSASRVRSGAPSTQSFSIEITSDARIRRQSCSPSRGRAPHGNANNNGSSIPTVSRARSYNCDDVNPVLIGTKMVERVVNMRKLAPPKQDNSLSNPAAKSSSSQDSSGFGRMLSKKSLDMAMRHMDIRRSIAGSLHPLATNIPASSVYSVRSGFTKSKTIGVSDSPLATSSYGSSEPSINNNSQSLDGSEVEDNDINSERAHTSPASEQHR